MRGKYQHLWPSHHVSIVSFLVSLQSLNWHEKNAHVKVLDYVLGVKWQTAVCVLCMGCSWTWGYIGDLNADKFYSFIWDQVLVLPYVFFCPPSVKCNLAILLILIQIHEIVFFFIQDTVCQIPLSFKMCFLIIFSDRPAYLHPLPHWQHVFLPLELYVRFTWKLTGFSLSAAWVEIYFLLELLVSLCWLH